MDHPKDHSLFGLGLSGYTHKTEQSKVSEFPRLGSTGIGHWVLGNGGVRIPHGISPIPSMGRVYLPAFG